MTSPEIVAAGIMKRTRKQASDESVEAETPVDEKSESTEESLPTAESKADVGDAASAEAPAEASPAI